MAIRSIERRPLGLAAPLLLAAVAACGAGDGPAPASCGPRLPEVGADVSFVTEVEALGVTLRDPAGAPVEDLLAFYAAQGMSHVRLRLWHTPTGPYSGLADVLTLARRAHAAGLGLLLDLHYSDHWADPGKQAKPAAWQELHGAALEAAVRDYTRDVVAALRAQGTLPEVVQLGNEITSGMLWDDGRVGGAFEAQWPDLARLLAAGAEGVRAGAAPEASPEVMIHIDRGGDPAAATWFYGALAAQGVEYDVIGLSFYPWWHGTQADLQETLAAVGRFDKPVVLVEVAYPFTLTDHDAEPNFLYQAGALEPGFDATPEGQRAWLDALLDLAQGAGVRGVYWWAPEYVGAPGLPSPWDNMTLFDGGGKALPALGALCRSP